MRDDSGGDGGGSSIASTSGDGAVGAAPACDGTCATFPPAPFARLTMVWIGAPADVPPCPDFAPVMGFEGFADLQAAPHTCPSCSCGPAYCALPTTMHLSAAKCSGDGAASIPFDAPAGWEGVCTDESAIPPGLLCEGVPCVQSLSVDAPIVEPCDVVEQGAIAMPAPSWGTMARECMIHVDTDGGGCESGESCAPVPPPGFSLCLFLQGDDPAYTCPDAYPRRIVLFDGIDDDRTCAPCACGDPAGADCAALVSVFTDPACSMMLAAVTVAPEQPACVDLPSGSGLGSKEAAFAVDKPGTCAPSGGEPSGGIQPAGPVTWCCEPEPEPAK